MPRLLKFHGGHAYLFSTQCIRASTPFRCEVICKGLSSDSRTIPVPSAHISVIVGLLFHSHISHIENKRSVWRSLAADTRQSFGPARISSVLLLEWPRQRWRIFRLAMWRAAAIRRMAQCLAGGGSCGGE